jgi:glycosyltransferase involved in cell wall biosynthesis
MGPGPQPPILNGDLRVGLLVNRLPMGYNQAMARALSLRTNLKKPTPREESPLLVSVILPVGEDIEMLDRAVNSVMQQTYADWELVVIGKGSVDGLYEDMRPWTRQNRRIQVIQLAGGSDSIGCHEIGLHSARGELVTHLDACDEFYPDYLEHVARHRDEADVLVFGYDLVHKNDAVVEHVAKRYPPAGRNVFALRPVASLGIAHRAAIVEQVGGFHELLLHHEDSPLWRRLKEATARLAFLPLKSGRRHVSIRAGWDEQR